MVWRKIRYFGILEGKTNIVMIAPRPPRSVAAPTASLQTRIVSQSVILTAFVVVVLTTLSFWIARAMLQQSAEAQMRSLSFIVEDSLGQTLQGYRERTAFMAAQEDVRAILVGGNGDGMQILKAMQQAESAVRGIALFSVDGEVVVLAGEAEGLQWGGELRMQSIPRVTDQGWERYDVTLPVRINDRIAGALAVRFSSQDVVAPSLTAIASLGSTARLLFIYKDNDAVQFIHPALQSADSFRYSVSDLGILSTLETLSSEGGVGRMDDERGRDVLVTYRTLPTLGWGMAVMVEREDVFAAVRRLALAHAATGTMLLVVAGALASVLARQVTNPLRRLTANVRRLGPGHWTVQKTVQTDDEVGVLERVIVDLSMRLRRLYDHLEEEITDRTEELKKQFALDRTILTTIAYGIVTVDVQGRVTEINPAAVTLLGISAEEAQGKAVFDVVTIGEKDGATQNKEHPVLMALQKHVLVRSKAGVLENMRRADGSLCPVTYVASPLLQGHEVFGAIIVFQDVSEERKLDERKSEFVTLASHQLRTPLSTVRWYVELLSDDRQQLTIEQREYLAEMQRGTDRMLALLTTLLHAAQYEGNGIQPTLSSFDIRSLVREICAENHELAREAHVRCTLNVPKGPLMVLTDPIHLKIVLQNLLSNAVKYTAQSDEKHVSLTVAARGGSVLLRVTDTGIGIPKVDQSRIFERFFRAENVRKIDTDGNGLGLSICKSIMERLGGTITFVSKENNGTTFTVTLPGAGKAVSTRKKSKKKAS